MKCRLIGRLLQSQIQITKRLSSISRAMKKIVLKGIEKAKGDYFDRVFLAYKCDMKRTWQVISETLTETRANMICLHCSLMKDVI